MTVYPADQQNPIQQGVNPGTTTRVYDSNNSIAVTQHQFHHIPMHRPTQNGMFNSQMSNTSMDLTTAVNNNNTWQRQQISQTVSDVDLATADVSLTNSNNSIAVDQLIPDQHVIQVNEQNCSSEFRSIPEINSKDCFAVDTDKSKLDIRCDMSDTTRKPFRTVRDDNTENHSIQLKIPTRDQNTDSKNCFAVSVNAEAGEYIESRHQMRFMNKPDVERDMSDTTREQVKVVRGDRTNDQPKQLKIPTRQPNIDSKNCFAVNAEAGQYIESQNPMSDVSQNKGKRNPFLEASQSTILEPDPSIQNQRMM